MNPLETIVAEGAPTQTRVRILRALVALLALVAAVVPASLVLADESPVAVRAVPQYAAVAQGGELVIAVEMSHRPHYHTWPAKAVSLPKDVDELAIRTEIGLPIDEKATDALREAAKKAKKPDAEIDAIQAFALPDWAARVAGVQYPKAKPGKVADPSGLKPTIDVPLYSGKAVAYIRVEVKADAPVGQQSIKVRASYQACDESSCMPPEDAVVSVKLEIVAKGKTDLGATSEPALFTGLDAKKAEGGSVPPTPPAASPPKKEDKKPENKPGAISSPPSHGDGAGPKPNLLGVNLGGGLLVLLLASALGGFVLNLTPCVLPVLPIKVLTLTQHATSRSHAIVLGIWMAIGVVAFWSLMGVPMAFVSAGLDPTRFVFGVWWIALALGGVIGVMGVGIMGLFSIPLPRIVHAVQPKADTAWGSLLMGVMTAVLGLPCFGFVAGGLLAGTASLPASHIMTVFVGLGVGMAAPYLVFAIWPNLLKFMPRTGPASELVKQLMGLLLMAAGAFFFAAGIRALLADRPYLSSTMGWWAVAFFVVLTAGWMVLRSWQISRGVFPRTITPILAALMIGGILWVTNGEVEVARRDYLAANKAMVGGATLVTGAWVEYTPERFEVARAARKTVVVDFTADWCLTCHALKRGVLDQDPIRSRITQDDVVLLLVDLTSRSAPGWQFLKNLEQTGIPTLAVYAPGSERPVILNAYTSSMVMQAIQQRGES